MTLSEVAIGSLSAIAPLLIGVSSAAFLVFGIIYAVAMMKKIIIASSVKSAETFERAKAIQERRERYYNEHLSWDARKEKRIQERFEKAHAAFNAKVNGQIQRERELAEYESWKEAHRSFERYFEGKEFQDKHVDNHGFIVVDDDDLRNAGSWQTDRGDEFPDVERFDREPYYVEKREEGAFLVRSEQQVIDFEREWNDLEYYKNANEDFGWEFPPDYEERRKAVDEYYESLRDQESEQYMERDDVK